MDRIQCPRNCAGDARVGPAIRCASAIPHHRRYDLDVDLEKARTGFRLSVFHSGPGRKSICRGTYTPLPPRSGRVLYLTADINKVLSAFAGGLEDGDRLTRIKRGNVRRLQKYLPVQYGHRGGYWWFTSFPLITGICRANNLIAVMRRTSWCTGMRYGTSRKTMSLSDSRNPFFLDGIAMRLLGDGLCNRTVAAGCNGNGGRSIGARPSRRAPRRYSSGVRSVRSRFLTTAGLPAASESEGISCVTTLPAAMMQRSPIVTPGQTVTLPPSQQSAPIVIGKEYSCGSRRAT